MDAKIDNVIAELCEEKDPYLDLGEFYPVVLNDDEWSYVLQCMLICEDRGLHPKVKKFAYLYDSIVDELNAQYNDEEFREFRDRKDDEKKTRCFVRKVGPYEIIKD